MTSNVLTVTDEAAPADTDDEEELDRAARSSPDEWIETLDVLFRDRLKRLIRRVLPAGPRDDAVTVADVYQKTLIESWGAAKKPSFDPRRSIRLPLRIARCRAIDAVRRRSRPGAALETDVGGGDDFLIDDLAGTETAADLAVADEEERRHVADAVAAVAARLPDHLRATVEAYVDHYGTVRGSGGRAWEPIASRVTAVLGREHDPVTAAEARRYFRTACGRIAAGLKKRGILHPPWQD